MDGAWFDRISAGDAQQLATDIGPVPANVGALLILDPPALRPEALAVRPDPPALRAEALAALVATRLSGIPRLRQRLHGTPFGGGRPVWVDDPSFDPRNHVRVIACPPPGDGAALRDLAVGVVTEPLVRSRPLWRAGIVTGLDGHLGVVLALHHVLADGIGGLALLADLVDPGPGELPVATDAVDRRAGHATRTLPAPRPAPTSAALRADAARARMRALRTAPQYVRALAPALTELGRHRPARAPRSSLNAPTGPRRRIQVVTTDLADLRSSARDLGATVNDVLLVAIARAMGSVLDSRAEPVPELVVSVPVSARPTASTDQLGNQVGVMPVRVPIDRPAAQAVRDVAAATSARRSSQRGASAAILAPAFRTLAGLGLFGPMINRQRLVNSFLTNMRGPGGAMTLGGAAVRRIAPITIAAGNVSVAFAALSSAGELAVTVIVDPDLVPELDDLAAALEHELASACSGYGSSSG